MLALHPAPQAGLLGSLAPPELAHGYGHPLVVYLAASIRRDVRLLAAMGAIGDASARAICSYLPCTASESASGCSDGGDDDTTAVLRALSPAASVAAEPGARRLNRQRSETAPLRPAQPQPQPQQQQHPGQAPAAVQLQIQRGPAPGSRKDRAHRHEGLGARLGAFFNRLTLDSETSPRARGSKGSITPASSPRSPTKAALSLAGGGGGPESPSRAHERSLSDALQSPQLERLKAVVQAEPKLPHRVTVSHCQAPLGIGPKRHQQLLRLDPEQPRKPSQGSHRSGASASSAASVAAASSAASVTIADHSSAASASSRASNRSSAASTMGTRKRSFTHLGLSMESLPAQPTSPLAGPAAAAAAGPRRALPGPASPDGGGIARLAATSNSLGLVLQASASAGALAAKPGRAKPLLAPIRAQRHHHNNSSSSSGGGGGGASSARDPRGLAASPLRDKHAAGLAAARHAQSPPPLARSAAPATLAFPPMPSEACQAAMLSGSAVAASSAGGLRADLPAAQRTPPPSIAKAFSDSTMAASTSSSLASLVLVATAAYDYTSGVKGDLEFAKGERIVIQSKVNDDWWFGSILPEAGRGSTGRSGMFPRSHVALG
ncbi:hypothetical protein H4R18_003934 [Coemansia javaensis]|uniref:SH3 domain-containing protein n=1 Tax=Coemansia javaensis TaxID=2761396 RepID=A0A9W8LHU8_9FUNG|nr:hypothetical protein H4R18_003934 [Coemansia javaensis]